MAKMLARTIERTAHMLVVNRTFDAPRRLVFEMWTTAEHLRTWFGPLGTTTLSCEVDARPGGQLRLSLRLVDGEDVWVRGTFHDVRAPERVSFSESFTDASGRTIKRPGFPVSSLVTVTFTEHESGTLVTVEHAGVGEDRRQTWSDTLAHLAAHISHHREETNQ